jgi:hypothetical protein
MPTTSIPRSRRRRPTPAEAAELERRGDRKKLFKAPDPGSLLYTRVQAARLLNTSVATLIRMENSGKLTAVKLNPESENGMVHYRAIDVQRLA